MLRPSFVWAAIAALYVGFFGWYTSFGGPLTSEEIDRYVAILEERAADPQITAALRKFLEEDTGDDFAMVNVIELREPPLAVEGVPPGETATQVLGRYMAFMWPELLRRACHPVVVGAAAANALDIWGIEGAESWSQGALMRYRSRRDMMEIAANPAFSGPHEFKQAAMLKTVAFPIDPWIQLGDPRLLLGLVLLVLGLSLHGPLRRRSERQI